MSNLDKCSRLALRYQKYRDEEDYNSLEIELRGSTNFVMWKIIKPDRLDIDDYYQIARIAVLEAIETWDHNRGNFKSFYISVLKYDLMAQLNKDVKYRDKIILNDTIIESEINDKYQLETNIYEILRQLFTERDLEVLNLFSEGASYKEIAIELSIPEKTVDNCLYKIRSTMAKYSHLF